MASSSHYHYHNDDDDEDYVNDSVEDYVNDYVEDYVNDYVQNFDEEPKERKQRIYMERHREDGHQMLWNDYFCKTPTYNVQLFRRRFRMNKSLFLRIVNRLTTNIPYFQQGKDCTGRSSLTPLQKCTAAIRQLAYGGAADSLDEYVRLAETTARKCLHNFTAGIISLFGDEYLRRPTHEDLQRLLYIGEQCGFPGIVGSIDCMHWEWKNCPIAWKGMYSRGTEKPTIVLEAVASSTMNDLNILDRSPVFDDIINGIVPQVNFYVNGNPYHLAYYLTDGIYPKCATFIQSIRLPQSEKHSLFAKTQEAIRKDVERAFGVLQARFAVVKNPSKLWDKEKIANIMKACIILHNMIVEDERSTFTQYN
uniref:DDE Tnp4 domain-containing protein n=1 Tax=Brassica oleracea var. oleracea TaxID=109376 RepID=A0A0D3AT07_BRAOL